MPKVIQLVFVRARTMTQGGMTPEPVLGFLHHSTSWGVPQWTEGSYILSPSALHIVSEEN